MIKRKKDEKKDDQDRQLGTLQSLISTQPRGCAELDNKK